MDMKIITIPDPIILKDPDTGLVVRDEYCKEVVLSFNDFLKRVFSNPCWLKYSTSIRTLSRIKNALDKCDGKHLAINITDWEMLYQSVIRPEFEIMHQSAGRIVLPGFGFHPLVTIQLLPFIEAILDARTETTKE